MASQNNNALDPTRVSGHPIIQTVSSTQYLVQCVTKLTHTNVGVCRMNECMVSNTCTLDVGSKGPYSIFSSVYLSLCPKGKQHELFSNRTRFQIWFRTNLIKDFQFRKNIVIQETSLERTFTKQNTFLLNK